MPSVHPHHCLPRQSHQPLLRRLAPGLALALACAGSAQALDLTVEVLNPKLQQGTINAALYNSPEFWLKDSQATGAQRVPVAEKTVLVFRNLQPGTYAVSLFHDENGNGKLDQTIVGLPTERYGFSRDARGRMGPPSFADAAVALTADTTLQITLN